ncbi:MAG: RES family NAD+ phosphorylase [Candidatus Eremiobacteraeota bacterium]|nr:RES family NAD+ phosphorylase [Candidatus Eremiobacteraeota bacterium]
MVDEARVRQILASAPLLTIDRYVTRFVYAAHQTSALEAVGAFKEGGRYNPPGVSALYTSLQRQTALAEATQFFEDEDPIRPMLMMSIQLQPDPIVLDLTNLAILRSLDTDRDELTQRIPDKRLGTTAPQTLGRLAESSGRVGALIVWSRVNRSRKNVVLFPDRLGITYSLYDPSGDIRTLHPAIADAVRLLMEPPHDQ